MSDVVVNIDVMTTDAEDVWEDASERLVAAKAAWPDIATPDFSGPFDASAIAAAYQTAKESIGSYLDGGSKEFLRFEERLLRAAIIYGESHGMSAAEIAALEAEIDG